MWTWSLNYQQMTENYSNLLLLHYSTLPHKMFVNINIGGAVSHCIIPNTEYSYFGSDNLESVPDSGVQVGMTDFFVFQPLRHIRNS